METSDEDESSSSSSSSNSSGGSGVSSYLNKNSVDNFKEMLELGEKISSSFCKIQSELAKPVAYKPVMKKRVYQLNRAYMDPPAFKDRESAEAATTTETEEKMVSCCAGRFVWSFMGRSG